MKALKQYEALLKKHGLTLENGKNHKIILKNGKRVGSAPCTGETNSLKVNVRYLVKAGLLPESARRIVF